MSTRIRSGLYQQACALVSFDIERNEGDYPGRRIGRWLVKAEIGDSVELWDNDFPTKRAAEAAIRESMAAGHYEYRPGLGWCYVLNDTDEEV